MNPFPWHPVDLGLKLALAPYAWFDPVLEWYAPPNGFSHGTCFGLARWGDAGKRCGYIAIQDFRGGFRECEFPLEELERFLPSPQSEIQRNVFDVFILTQTVTASRCWLTRTVTCSTA